MIIRLFRTMILLGVLLTLAACGGGSGGESVGLSEPTPIPLPSPRGLTPSLEMSDQRFESVHFSGSTACSSCHNEQAQGEFRTMVDSNGRDLSIGVAWESSMMANAARDPYWHAVVASELHNYPNLAEEINDTCTRCHAPMANEAGRRTGDPIQPFDSGSVADGNFRQGFLSMTANDEVFNHAMDGVSCSVCHQIADDGNLGTAAGMTGGFHIEQYSEENIDERPAYGQYTDIDVGYMKNQARFTPQFGAHISTSETCATCHNLQSHSVDRNGVAVPNARPFPEQMVYSEWLVSDYAVGKPLEANCQDCHMPKVADAVAIAGAGAGGAVHNDFAEHTFLGANTVMLDMLKNNRELLGIPSRIDFQAAIERNRRFLNSAATVEIVSGGVADGTLTVDVQITNHTGHKLPSAYHSRRVWIHVLVTNGGGEVIYENGLMNDNGSINGVIEDINPYVYEPHYDVITDATQVQVYQSIMGNSDDERTHSLLNGTHYLKDNRLTPAGFNKNNLPESVTADIAVTGAARSDGNFNWGSDTVTYKIPVGDNDDLNVLAELRYQPLSYGHLQHLFASSDKIDQIDQFRTLYDSARLFAETIDTAQLSIP